MMLGWGQSNVIHPVLVFQILDEVYRILSYIQSTHSPLGRAYKVTDELFDLSTMAMEYFKVPVVQYLFFLYIEGKYTRTFII